MKNFLVIFILFFSAMIYAQTPTIKLVSDVWPPFTDVEGEEALAFNLVQEAFDRIDTEVELLITDFKSVESGIKEGTYQGSSAFWMKEERYETMYYSDAYLHNQLILLGRKGTNVDIKRFSELSGQKIGLVKGYSYGDSLSMVEDLQITYGKNDQENLENLLSNKVDLILVDAILIEYMLNYQINDVSQLLEFAKTPIITRSLHVALNKTVPDSENIIAKLNKEFKTMISDGTYNKILHFDWIHADVDGDGVLDLVFTGDRVGTSQPSSGYAVHSLAQNNDQKTVYLNGEKYDNWEDVPSEYKVEMPKTEFVPTGNFGVILKF